MANFGDISYGLSVGAGQSVRRNAGDTAYEAYTPSAGSFSWGNTISSGSGTGIAMTTADLAGDKPFITMAHTASGTLTSNSTVQFSISSSRTATGGTPSDNFDVATFSRTNITNGANLTAAGTVVKISGTDTQTANTLTPTYDLLQLNPSLRSTGSALNIVVPSSVVTAPTNAYFNVTVGNTQTLTLTAGKIDTGTDASPGQIGLDIRNINGASFNGSTPIAGLLVNSFASATQGLVDIAASVWLGKNYNTNSNFSIINLLVDNTANAGAGANAGIVVRNAATDFAIPASTFAGEGAGIHVQQTGVGGTAYSLQTSANINSSTNGLVNYTLNNTQSGATVMQKIDLGTSTQAHTGLLVNVYNASSTVSGIKIDPSTTCTGYGINFSASGGGGFRNIFFNNISASAGTRYGIYQTNIIAGSGSPVGYGIWQNTIANATGTAVGWYVNNIGTGTTGNGGKYFSLNNDQSSASLEARTNDASEILFSRTGTHTTGTVADNFNLTYFKRTTVQNGAGGTITAAGSVLKLENVATQTAGTLTDSVTPLLIVQGASSTGAPISVTQNAVVSTNFKKIAVYAGVTLWVSNGTDPNGTLSGTAGDICYNGATNKPAYCTGTTNWTNFV